MLIIERRLWAKALLHKTRTHQNMLSTLVEAKEEVVVVEAKVVAHLEIKIMDTTIK